MRQAWKAATGSLRFIRSGQFWEQHRPKGYTPQAACRIAQKRAAQLLLLVLVNPVHGRLFHLIAGDCFAEIEQDSRDL